MSTRATLPANSFSLVLIDTHAHIYPDDVADKVIGSIEKFYGVARTHNATYEELIESLDRGGFDKAVVLPIATKPEHVKLNDWYAELGQRSERIIPFGGIHPDNDPSELDRFPALGLKGLKIQPNALRVFPADERMMRIYEKAIANDLIVTFHAGDEESGFRGEFSRPKDFVPVLEKYPEMRTVLSHLGGYQTWEDLDLVLGYPNVWYDTAHVPGNLADEEIRALVKRIGLDRVVFGSDYPFADHEAELEAARRVFGRDTETVVSHNPQRLLEL
jgi:predicted TIM-barrel fold metal-dependent hydrolase